MGSLLRYKPCGQRGARVKYGKEQNMLCGIDLGSRSVKLALSPDEPGCVWSGNMDFVIYDTLDFYRRFTLREKGALVLNIDALDLPKYALICACGYGKQAAALSCGKTLSEIQAHAGGVMAQTGADDFLLIDLGGQDSKIIRVKNGRVSDFAANDKCAAGSGRYLENMAAILGFDMEMMGSFKENPLYLSSTCAVFGESELIGKIAEGCSPEQLAAGVNYSVARRLIPIIKRYLPLKRVFFSGGAAQNEAIGFFCARELGQEMELSPNPQYNGAIGCCYCLSEAAV
jgi:predicted CoA-substrate-specific enzyme activase